MVTQQKVYPSLERCAGFMVFEKNDPNYPKEAEIIGEITIKDGGFAVDCEFEAVKKLAVQKAKAMGANAIWIYEHKLPSPLSSTCHRIKAKAVRIENLPSLENEIVWCKGRRLKIADFKGTTENRPFQAATVASFNAKSWASPYSQTGTFEVETVFNCRASYFKIEADSIATLAHEQVHFDITELYARKFVQRIQQNIKFYRQLNREVQPIYDAVFEEMRLMHDKFDSEVYPDPSKEALWIENIKLELEKMAAFENKQLELIIM